MRADNHYYGHNLVLAEYVGLDAPPPIWGYLQHGWNPGSGFPARYKLAGRYRKFVWNADNRRVARAIGGQNIIPIGSPFLYAVSAYVRNDEQRSSTGRTIVYPYHSAPGLTVEAHHEQYADELLRREGPETTVCLYWLDAQEGATRDMYVDRGFRVICHGLREDPSFLHRQISELHAHDRVVSNRAATAIFYGAYLGLETQVYGEVWSSEGQRERSAFEAEQFRRWPELVTTGVRGGDAVALGSKELGLEFVLPPKELRRTLGWSGAYPAIARSMVAPALRTRSRIIQSARPPTPLATENVDKSADVTRRRLSILLFVTLWGQPSETFVRREVEALQLAGHKVTVVSMRRPAQGFEAEYLDARAVVLGVLRTMRNPARAKRCIARVLRETSLRNAAVHLGATVHGLAVAAQYPGADVAHAHFAWLAASSADAYATCCDIPLSVFPHAFDIYEDRYVDRHLSAKLHRAAVIAVESSTMQQHLQEAFEVESTVIRIGVPRDLVVSQPTDREGFQPLILSVGMLREKKGHDVLLRAIARLEDVSCLIIGEGPERERLSALIDELELGERARLVGLRPVEDVIRTIDSAHAFCLASRVTADGDRDGVPNVLIEAMARGVPVVSTSVSGIPDLLGEDRGWVVPPDDPEALAETLRQIVAQPQASLDRARAALRHVEQNYVVESNVAHLERLLVCATREPGSPA